MQNIYFLLAILIANAIAIGLIYQFIKKLPKKEILIFMAVTIAAVYILVALVYWVSGFSIDSDVHEAAKTTITYIFVPVNAIIVIPYIAHQYMKKYKKEINKEAFIKKVIVAAVVLIVVLIGEYFYFKNIQENIKEIADNTQENVLNTNVQTDEY